MKTCSSRGLPCRCSGTSERKIRTVTDRVMIACPSSRSARKQEGAPICALSDGVRTSVCLRRALSLPFPLAPLLFSSGPFIPQSSNQRQSHTCCLRREPDGRLLTRGCQRAWHRGDRMASTCPSCQAHISAAHSRPSLLKT